MKSWAVCSSPPTLSAKLSCLFGSSSRPITNLILIPFYLLLGYNHFPILKTSFYLKFPVPQLGMFLDKASRWEHSNLLILNYFILMRTILHQPQSDFLSVAIWSLGRVSYLRLLRSFLIQSSSRAYLGTASRSTIIQRVSIWLHAHS